MSRRISRFCVSLIVVAFAACASGSQTTQTSEAPETGAGGGISIQVDNNRPDARSIVVHVIPEGGVRRQLGSVDATRTGNFTYQGVPGRYRLIAVDAGGEEFQSESFRLFDNSTATWNMQTNRVSVTGS